MVLPRHKHRTHAVSLSCSASMHTEFSRTTMRGSLDPRFITGYCRVFFTQWGLSRLHASVTGEGSLFFSSCPTFKTHLSQSATSSSMLEVHTLYGLLVEAPIFSVAVKNSTVKQRILLHLVLPLCPKILFNHGSTGCSVWFMQILCKFLLGNLRLWRV